MSAAPRFETYDDEAEALAAAFMDRRRAAKLRVWTRKFHNYIGLCLLLFVWLFSVSGLVLNHSKWSAAQFWKQRRETTADRVITAPTATGDLAIASDLMRQLGIVGEIGETKRDQRGAFEFQVVRPGVIWRVQARLDSARAVVTETRLNKWGVMDALHKLTGVNMDQPALQPDWILTRLWRLAMDALAFGLIVLVLSGVYLWWRLTVKRSSGLIALTLGMAACAFFLFGLGTLIG